MRVKRRLIFVLFACSSFACVLILLGVFLGYVRLPANAYPSKNESAKDAKDAQYPGKDGKALSPEAAGERDAHEAMETGKWILWRLYDDKQSEKFTKEHATLLKTRLGV